MKELQNLNTLLAEFFKDTLDSETLYEWLKEYESQGKQFLLKEARARLEDSFRAEKLRIKFEEVGDGRLSVQLLEEEVKRGDEAIKQETNLVIELTVNNFDEQVRKHTLLVVDCWAAWCAPCRMVAPVVEGLARDYRGKVAFGKLDVDRNPSLAMKYRIMSIPTLLVFKDGGDGHNAINAATGWDMKVEEFLEIGGRIQTLRQLFNAREGAIRHEMPQRAMGSPPLKRGGNRGTSVDPETIVQGYYRGMGFSQDGVPTEETLRSYGLDDLVPDLKSCTGAPECLVNEYLAASGG